MSHIHLPDGILPIAWWLGGYIATFIILLLILHKMNRFEATSRIPRVAMAAAFMLIAMSVPLGFIPIHLSMAVLTGIIVGPGLGFVAVFIVNFILSLVGHGGITIVGLNTIVIGAEVLVGAYLFRSFVRNFSPARAAFFSVVPAVILSLVLMVGIVGATAGYGEALPVCEHDHSHEHDHEHDNSHRYEKEHEYVKQNGKEDDRHHVHDHISDHNQDYNNSDGSNDGELNEIIQDVHIFTLTGWGALGVILLSGLVLEAGVTSLIVRYVNSIRPDMISAIGVNDINYFEDHNSERFED
ncbi:energy-coupling factor ABC transporter permease [Natranaerofaba carboxydovora]|uniref:energy-coupling factor ABC transporter permease n=1 Tax=Natranaerofaba carboxydovora TaxID=2742683 RepID=UPI001F14129D|nr:energy-coupling factor ABC transporter permease [Natranaerofaba carboxydovora]UMZ74177.1 Cobalt uptake substrate-specific transmembrane region [Natranaerofaba carboxydovora]